MKVLWFSITPVFFNDQDAGKGGAGWISALERVVARDNDIQLYVAYLTTKSFTPSQLLSYNPYQSIVIGFETAIGVGGGKVDFFASSGTSSPIYKTSFIWAGSGLGTTINGQLDGVVYPVISTGGAYYNYPMPSTEFVKSFAGRFATKINGIGYSMVYDGILYVFVLFLITQTMY